MKVLSGVINHLKVQFRLHGLTWFRVGLKNVSSSCHWKALTFGQVIQEERDGQARKSTSNGCQFQTTNPSCNTTAKLFGHVHVAPITNWPPPPNFLIARQSICVGLVLLFFFSLFFNYFIIRVFDFLLSLWWYLYRSSSPLLQVVACEFCGWKKEKWNKIKRKNAGGRCAVSDEARCQGKRRSGLADTLARTLQSDVDEASDQLLRHSIDRWKTSRAPAFDLIVLIADVNTAAR